MAAAPEPSVNESAESPGLTQQFGHTLTAARHLLGDLVELFGLEARLAGLSAAKVLAIAIVAAFTVIAAWLFIQGALITWIYQLGFNLGLAFLLFAVINLAVTAGLAYAALRSSRNMTFAATRRALKKEPPEHDEQPQAADSR